MKFKWVDLDENLRWVWDTSNFSDQKPYRASFPGYETHGEENIPKGIAGMIVFHHAHVPVDAFYYLGKKNLQSRPAFGGNINRDLRRVLPGMCEVRSLAYDDNKQKI